MLAADFERAIAGGGVLPGRRFAVYRNNIMSALIGALKVRYPVVEALTGEKFFAAMAGDFVQAHRPRSPIFSDYGGAFPMFVESYRRAASVPYLSDIARLESAWFLAYHSQDREPLAPEAFASGDPEVLARWRFTFLPSFALVPSRWPIVAIWTAHREARDLGHIDLERGETALVVRPHLDVVVTAITEADARFIAWLVEGKRMGEAYDATRDAYPGFDPTAALSRIVATRAVAAIVSKDDR